MDEQEPVAHVYRIEANGRPCVAWDNASEIKVGAKLYVAPREWVGLTGMTMRDYFAAKAMASYIQNVEEQQFWGEEYSIEEMLQFTAERAYDQADAMLIAREKGR